MKNNKITTKILSCVAIAVVCISISSCSPYNGNPQHDTVIVARKILKTDIPHPKHYVRELVEYGYDKETAESIVNDAFREATRGL